MDNIYLTKNGNFAYDNLREEVPFDFDKNLIDKWVKKFKLKDTDSKDFTIEINGNRYRIHLSNSLIGWSAALRLLPQSILSFKQLGLDAKEILSVCSGIGLTLFCGPTGAGKSTTMNTVIDSLFKTNELGVTITIEDPIEYLHKEDIIFQREVGTHVVSFEEGLIDAVRANPKTIVIGEIRDRATAIEAVRAGLNGHRVFATLHASNTIEAINRVLAFLDDQDSKLLVQSLQGIIAQHLVYFNNGSKRCIYESILVDRKVKNVLNQALNRNSEVSIQSINNSYYDQKRLKISERKQILLDSGINERFLRGIGE